MSICIVQQSVKEVVQGLIDDGLVNSDKIGPSNYYWSYPSAAEHAVCHRLYDPGRYIQY